MKEIIYTGEFQYQGHQRQLSICELTMLQTPDRLIVIATEIAQNPGTSITNAYKLLAQKIVEEFQINPLTALWIEHYNDKSYTNFQKDNLPTNRYAWVRLTWQFNRWLQIWEAKESEFLPLREENYVNLLTAVHI
jgi:hypothetical protein